MTTLSNVPEALVFCENTAPADSSMLLLAAEPAASEFARALSQQIAATVQIVTDRKHFEAALQRQPYSLLVVEESLITAAAEEVDWLYQAPASSLIVEVNFALAGADRLVQQVRVALRRRAQEEQRTRSAARQGLQEELNASLTGLLLESQLALRQVDPRMVPALERLVALAEHLCEQFQR